MTETGRLQEGWQAGSHHECYIDNNNKACLFMRHRERREGEEERGDRAETYLPDVCLGFFRVARQSTMPHMAWPMGVYI